MEVDKKYISNKTLMIKIILGVLAISVVLLFISTEYLKRTAVSNLAEDDAKKTAQLVFETMNVRMQEGWTKKDLNGIIKRLEHIRKGMKIASYRSKQVEELFGVIKSDREILKRDKLLQKAMGGEEVFKVNTSTGEIRFLYPMKVTSKCTSCHTNAKEGSINGVLEITFPHSDIKISLDSLTFYFVCFSIVFLISIAYFFFLVINKKMIKPVIELTKEIKELDTTKDLTKEVDIKTNIEELWILQNSFNKLLKTIRYYYAKLIENLYLDEQTNSYNLLKLQKDIKNLDQTYGLMIIDIKSFGKINRVYGASVADELLVMFVEATKSYFGDKAVIYRLYGDEFAIVYSEPLDLDIVDNFRDNIKHKRFNYKDSEFIMDITIGYVENISQNALENANIALRAAKKERRNVYGYNNSLAVKNEDNNHIVWLKILNNAIENDTIVPFFMPMKNTKTKKIDKYETLVRIIDKDVLYTPDKFIDIAIASGKYHIITQTIIRKTFEYFKDIDDIQFSMNFALRDIVNEETTGLLFRHLEEYPYSSNVIIELLETEEISDFDLLNKFINKIKSYGAKVAIDDFGSGYSNFNYILNLNIDIVKLDSCLVADLYTNQSSVVIVSNLVKAVKELKLQVVAEMVTSQEIEKILTIHEVDYLQGYYIGKPQKDILER